MTEQTKGRYSIHNLDSFHIVKFRSHQSFIAQLVWPVPAVNYLERVSSFQLMTKSRREKKYKTMMNDCEQQNLHEI